MDDKEIISQAMSLLAKRRSDAMTPEQRSAQASKASKARWDKRDDKDEKDN
ncbi:hypothetical protein N8148_03010 [Gammaproteobacteria bacterium]|nr:hypothetical protein [Gammaproteobacteria bacterium]